MLTSAQFPKGRKYLDSHHHVNEESWMTQRQSSLLFDFVDPHNHLNSTKLSCYGGSYYVTIVVVSYQSKTSESIRPSMPMSHRQFLHCSLPHFRSRSPFRTIIYRYQPPSRVLRLSTSTYIFSYSLTFWFDDMSMGHVCLVCTHI
jgi:hypothetical protein